MHTFHTGTVQKVDSVGQTVQFIEYHPADTGLYYQLGTFDTWRSGDVQSGILARVVAAGKLGYGICLGMQHIRFGVPVGILAYIFETGRGAVSFPRKASSAPSRTAT